jgi:hypothetical protein
MMSWNMRQGVAKLEGRVNVSHNTLPNHPVEPTAYSVRSCLASASGGGSPPALARTLRAAPTEPAAFGRASPGAKRRPTRGSSGLQLRRASSPPLPPLSRGLRSARESRSGGKAADSCCASMGLHRRRDRHVKARRWRHGPGNLGGRSLLVGLGAADHSCSHW